MDEADWGNLDLDWVETVSQGDAEQRWLSQSVSPSCGGRRFEQRDPPQTSLPQPLAPGLVSSPPTNLVQHPLHAGQRGAPGGARSPRGKSQIQYDVTIKKFDDEHVIVTFTFNQASRSHQTDRLDCFLFWLSCMCQFMSSCSWFLQFWRY